MNITSYGYIEKASKLNEGEVEFIVSTNDWDAHGERINVEGINIKDFNKNPVVLYGHDSFNLPVAKATKVWKENGKLMARAKFYLKDDFPRKIYNYIVDGFLSAVSIGGMVEEWGDDGRTINKLTMKEFSVVSIPANQNALVTAKSFDNSQVTELKALGNSYARKLLAQDNNELLESINVLETLVTTLKEVAISEPHDESVDSQNIRRVVLRSAQAVDNQAEKVIKTIKLKVN